MRRVKFKAILEKESIVRDVLGIDFLNLKVLVSISGSHEWHKYKKLLQYTGLEDKNGVEIYGGDIIKNITDYNTIVHGDYVLYEIVYRSGMWVVSYVSSESGKKLPTGYTAGHIIDLLDDVSKEIYFTNLDKTDFEVIGNIYENPELEKES
ncbi:MAG: hypothetical protein GY941_21285 [Planctomycetes bacterium]|nr:hypothetical protein [Planctomycetota bacterium]